MALIPDVVKSLRKTDPDSDSGSKLDIVIESGAGAEAGHTDEQYTEAEAEVADAGAAWGADVVLHVAVPSSEEIGKLRQGQVFISHLAPLTSPDTTRALKSAGVTSFAMESIPRITRAQAMDALSSQANVAGYAAALLAAREAGRFFPMMTTAAGTVAPAKVLVLGAGVAGLQAIATAKRLGAIVSGFDIRRAAWEQIASLGGRPLELDFIPDAEDEGGYARPLTEEENEKVREALAETSSRRTSSSRPLDPGRPAPTLLTAEAVRGMKPGSVIVDMAAESGGNASRPSRADGRSRRRQGDRAVEPAQRDADPRLTALRQERREPARADGRRGRQPRASTSTTTSSPAPASPTRARSVNERAAEAAGGDGAERPRLA